MKTSLLAVGLTLSLAAAAGLAVYAFQLRSDLAAATSGLDAERSEVAGIEAQLDRCQEAADLGKQELGNESKAYAELITLYSMSTQPSGTVNPGVSLQEQDGKWQEAEDRISPETSSQFFDLATECLSY